MSGPWSKAHGSRPELAALWAAGGAAVAVILEKPGRRHQADFLRHVRASRRLHRPWVAPPRTAAAYRAYVRRLGKGTHEGFLIRVAPDGDLAGVVNLNEIVRGGLQSAYLGYYAFAPLAGRGHLREGLARVLDVAFGELGLHRVEANIQPGNRRSSRLVRSLGFRREGHSPRYLKIGGRWCDHDRWALLAEEWKRGGRRGRSRERTSRES